MTAQEQVGTKYPNAVVFVTKFGGKEMFRIELKGKHMTLSSWKKTSELAWQSALDKINDQE